MRLGLRYIATVGVLMLIYQQWADPFPPICWTVWGVAVLCAITADWAVQRWGNTENMNTERKESNK